MNIQQCRAARALLGWSQQDLAEAAKLSISTVRDFELEKRSASDASIAAMKIALEREGVELLEDFSVNAAGQKGGCGVRFSKPSLHLRPAETLEERMKAWGELAWKAGVLVQENPNNKEAMKTWKEALDELKKLID